LACFSVLLHFIGLGSASRAIDSLVPWAVSYRGWQWQWWSTFPFIF